MIMFFFYVFNFFIIFLNFKNKRMSVAKCDCAKITVVNTPKGYASSAFY